MAKDQRSVEVAAFFGTQMLAHIVRNLVANGIFPEAGIRTNIQETIDQATRNFGEEHHRHIVQIAKAFEEAVAEGVKHRNKLRSGH